MSNVIGALIIVTIMSPFTGIPAVILVIVFYFMREYYLTASSGLKRLEAIGNYKKL